MTDQKALLISNAIFKDVFGRENPFTLEEIEAKLTEGIILPTTVHCVRSGVALAMYDPQPENLPISEEEYEKESKVTDWLRPKIEIHNMDELLEMWKKNRFMAGNKALASQDVEKSDSVTSSQEVYMSTLIGNSKDILYSHNNYFSNYLLACRGNSSCNFDLRVFDSIYCSSCYEVRWSNKVAKSFFINDSLDLYECMFCFGLRAKKYCVANMQYEKEEYLKIKAMVIDWIFQSTFS